MKGRELGDKYYFDEKEAQRVIAWIEKFCTHTEGDLVGEPVICAEYFKKDVVYPFFGWRKKKDGLRKHTTLYLRVPRGNAKTLYAACLCMFLLEADGEAKARICAAAASKKQANELFGSCKQMIGQNKALGNLLKGYTDVILDLETLSKLEKISAEAGISHGRTDSAAVIDEFHAQPNRDLYDVIYTGLGKRARRTMIIITTRPFAGTYPDELDDYAIKVKDGLVDDPTFLPVLYGADPEDDPFDEDTWKKANPGWEFMNHEAFAEKATRAKNSPSFLNTFKQLHLNIRVSSTKQWIPPEEWGKGANKVDLMKLIDHPCWVGLDCAQVRDLNALCVVWPDIDGMDYVYWMNFCPSTQVNRRSAHNIKYDKWVKGGFITVIPGNSIVGKDIAPHVIDFLEGFNVQSINYDRKFATDVVNELTEKGYRLFPFGQGHVSMNRPLKYIESRLAEGNIIHGDNPVINWQMSNAHVTYHEHDNISLSKKNSKDKIDAIVAMAMAYGGYLNDREEESKNPIPEIPDDFVMITG